MQIDNNFFIEVDYIQKFKFGQKVCGDTFLSSKVKDDKRIIATLSDGLGSGVRANVISSMTAKMALTYSCNKYNIIKAAETIMKTLPVDSIRKISYATFTIVDIDYQGKCSIVDYDNPPFILLRGNKSMHPYIKSHEGKIENLKRKYTINMANFQLELGDKLIFFSDGVNQSGMGSNAYPLGWGNENVREYCQFLVDKYPNLSARSFAQEIVEHATANSNYKPQDDITCCVINIRKPRKLVILTGPPINQTKDKYLAEIVSSYEGNKAICGGTTAKILARELNRNVEVDISSLDPIVPCSSYMEGVNLVTEGMITMGETLKYLKSKEFIENINIDNGATKLVKLLLSSDIIDFYVGTKINDAHQDPNMPIELGIRRNTIRRIAKVLEDRYLKDVKINFV
ncbi:SpoIIE family protein phosphatase [bacterium]|nr:SpoIIE family protein phosphatase [bacterium]